MLFCPDCGGANVVITEEQMFMANTLEHYCHSVKIQDPNAKAECLDPGCGWKGHQFQLKTDE